MILASSHAFAQATDSELPIEVVSEDGRYDVSSGAYVLTGNVRITRGSLSVFADEARSFNNDSGEVERIELYGAPTRWNDTLEDGTAVDGRSDEIEYDFTTNLITMRGNAEIRNVQGQFSGTQLVYNLDTESLAGGGGVRLLIEPATAASATQQVIDAVDNGEPGGESVEADQPPEPPVDSGDNADADGTSDGQ
jgi:lipopolysaccharide export system protein LptA